jgi:hypothetical protein
MSIDMFDLSNGEMRFVQVSTADKLHQLTVALSSSEFL